MKDRPLTISIKGRAFWLFSFLSLFFISSSLASNSLSYSGRLVNADGSPVTGLVNLKADLAYTNDTTVILCTQSFTGVSLTNGVFHLKLNLDCGTDTLEEVLQGIQTNESVAIRITDQTHAKVYSFQALHSMPLATMAGTAKTLVQMNAVDGQVLTWDSGAWKPLAPATLAAGSVGTTELADGSVTDPKVATGISRGKLAAGTPGYVLVNDGSGLISETPQLSILQGGTGASTAAGAWTNLGIVIGTAAGQFMGADAVPSCAANEKLFMTLGPTYLWDCIPDGDATKLPLAGGRMSGAIDMFTNRILDLGSPIDPGDATNKAYVDSEISAINSSQWITNGTNIHFDTGNVGLGTSTPTQKLDVIGNVALSGKAMFQSDNANYVELKAPLALASTLTFHLPGSYGTSGYALITDGAGNLSWSSVATTSTSIGGDLSGSISNAQIVAGAIVDADVSGTAAIAQSKIAGLTTDLAAKEPTIAVGTTAQYLRGDKTWQTLNSSIVPEVTNLYFTEPRVLGTDLAGLATTAGTVTATDTILTSIGKLVGNVDAISSSQANYVLKAGDTMSGALAMGSNPITGLAEPTALADAATKNYVDTQVATKTSSQWTTAGSNIHFDTGNVGLGTSTPAQKLDVIGNIALTGKLQLKSDTANYLELKAPLSLASTLTFNFPGTYGTSGYALITDGAGNLSWSSVATTSTSVGGDLSGSISNAQIVAGAIVDADVSGTAAIAQSKIAGLTTDLASKEPTIAAGTTAQYWRGDKSWQTLNTSIVPEGTNLYFTEPKVLGTDLAGLATTAGTVTATDTVLSSIGKLVGNVNALSTSQANYVLKAGDTMSGALAMGSNKITGLAEPTALADAATKNYVDTQVATKTSSQWTTTGSDIYYNTGNVGVGTTLPSRKLSIDLATTDTVVGPVLDSYPVANFINASSGGGRRGLEIGAPTGSLSSPVYLKVSGTGNRFSILNNTDIENFTILDSGNVGIGATTPSQKLHVEGVIRASSGASVWDITPTNTTNSPLVFIDRVNSVRRGLFLSDGSAFFGGNIGNDAGSGASLSILANGNVGIGNNIPVEKLDVAGNVALTGKLRLKSDNANYVELKAPLALGATLSFNLPGNYGTSGQALITNGSGALSWSDVATTATAIGGDLSGTIANAQLISGAVGSAEIADGSIVDADVSLTAAIAQSKIAGLTTDLAAKEPTIAAGTTAQYWRGDKTWQTLNTTAVPEGTNLYFLDSRVRAALLSGYAVGSAIPVAATDTLIEALGKLEGQIIANDAAFDSTGQWSKNGSSIYFNTGNVGIGTNNPTSKFEVSSADVGTRMAIINTDTTAGAVYPGLSVMNYNGSTSGHPYIGLSNSRGSATTPAAVQLGDNLGAIIGYGHNGSSSVQTARIQFFASENFTSTSAPSYMTFSTASPNTITYSERMRISSLGNVGIGSTSPDEKLVVSSTGTPKISLVDSDNLETDATYTSYLVGRDSANTDVWYVGEGSSAKLVGLMASRPGYRTFIGTNGVERISVTELGNVGIGTTTPVSTLAVGKEDGSVPGRLTVNPEAATLEGGQIELKAAPDYAGNDMILDNYGGRFRIVRTNPSGSEVMNITQNGDVGIGTVPQAKLHVNGNIAWNVPWTGVTFSANYQNHGSGWQFVQYRKIGDIVYIRGLAARVSGSVTSGDLVFTLPSGFCPPAHLAFTTEPHSNLTTKHRVDILNTCSVNVATTAGATPYVSFDGIFFSVTN